MATLLQPLIHHETVVLRAPTQAWSARDGSIGSAPVHGVYFSDLRIVSAAQTLIGGETGENIQAVPHGASSVTFVAVERHLDDPLPDPRVRSLLTRTARIDGITETVTVASALADPIGTSIVATLTPDLAHLDAVKIGIADPDARPAATIDGQDVRWGNDSVSVTLSAPGADIRLTEDARIELSWLVEVPGRGSVSVEFELTASDSGAILAGVVADPSWSTPSVTSGDDRLGRWLDTALDDLLALRLTTATLPGEVFLAAGAPWFFTLFGRDSIWAARMLLPLGTDLAASTLRVLASMQGTESVDATAEQPGKIMHELRRDGLEMPSHGLSLPPLYYGTVDATPLWLCLLHDAWRWGMPDDEVRALLPQAVAALEWMRDFGDADGDGLLEYVDATGHGLANQGWKDSGDSVQWLDGSLGEGPIALCEVQAYAFEAATHGADLLDHFGVDGADAWRAWADRLRTRFHASFWIDSADGAYPAIALDAQKRAIDTVTSNLGHLLGTGLLDDRQSALVARRLVAPDMSTGFGLRTMSSASGGYWPLSYHGGSVWTHDTAIAITGLAKAGFGSEAAQLSVGLLAAASGFDYRMPELYSGDDAAIFGRPVPYPAACRPQAWSAAASVSVLASALGLDPNAQSGVLGVAPSTAGLGAISVRGLRFAGADVSIEIDAHGDVTGATGATFEVR